MSAIKPSCIRDLKARVSVLEVVGRVATLRKAGSRFKGLCPFHSEKTPSFHVDPDRGLYKCFGCGKAGDIISFVRETEQLNFTEAIEALGKRFNVPIEYEEGSGPTKEERTLRQELFDLHEIAAEHFHQQFRGPSPTGEYMRAYWKNQRRFPLELAEEFKIGAAPAEENSLAAELLKRKFSEEALRQSGLFFIRDGALLTLGALRPRFRGRLMIPIRDHQGRVVAFTARQTELTPDDDPAREAKYVNSPETPIFTKGHLLFNLDRARSQVGDGRPFVMVEGQLDALRSWQVGLKTAIAPQGTAITESQLALLRRYHPQVECFFDSDSAGQKASLRFLPLALKAGIEVRFLGTASQQKLDPDLLFLEKGLEGYDEVKKHSRSAMAFACASLLPDPDKASAEQKSRACQELFTVLAACESEVTRAAFLEEAAPLLKVSIAALARDAHQSRQREARPVTPAPLPSAQPVPVDAVIVKKDSPEHHLLMICLHFEGYGKLLSCNVPADWLDQHDLSGRLLNRFLGEFEHDSWPGRDHLDSLIETGEEKTLVASLLFEPPQTDEPKRLIAQALTQLRQRALTPKLRQIELALARVQEDSNVDALSLIKQRTELQKQLRAPFVLPDAD